MVVFTNQSTGGFLVTPYTATGRSPVQICEWFVDTNANSESTNSCLLFSGLSDEHKERWQLLQSAHTHTGPIQAVGVVPPAGTLQSHTERKRLSSSRQGERKGASKYQGGSVNLWLNSDRFKRQNRRKQKRNYGKKMLLLVTFILKSKFKCPSAL